MWHPADSFPQNLQRDSSCRRDLDRHLDRVVIAVDVRECEYDIGKIRRGIFRFKIRYRENARMRSARCFTHATCSPEPWLKKQRPVAGEHFSWRHQTLEAIH